MVNINFNFLIFQIFFVGLVKSKSKSKSKSLSVVKGCYLIRGICKFEIVLFIYWGIKIPSFHVISGHFILAFLNNQLLSKNQHLCLNFFCIQSKNIGIDEKYKNIVLRMFANSAPRFDNIDSSTLFLTRLTLKCLNELL